MPDLPSNPSSLLIIRMSSLGDVITSLPTLVALRRRFPQARIGWVVEDRFASVIEGHPYIDELFVVPLKSWARAAKTPQGLVRSYKALCDLKRRLRAAKYEVSLDIHGIVKSDVMAGFARCPVRIAFRDACYRHSANVVVDATSGIAAVRFTSMATYLGAENPEYDACFYIPEPESAWAEETLLGLDFGAAGPLVAVNPGASAPWRQWPAASFATVAEALQEQRDARIVVIGGPGEVPLAEAIAERMSRKPLVVAGRCSVKGLAALLRRCDLLVTADTGPMHLAAAVHTPTVSFFGSADPKRTGPVGDFHSIVMATGPEKCVPCRNHPNCKTYPCLDNITPAAIIEAALERLALPRPRPAQVP